MDYNFLGGGAGLQRCPFSSYGTDVGLSTQDLNHDSAITVATMENPLDGDTFMTTMFDYTPFDPNFHGSTGAGSMSGASISPTSPNQGLFPHDSGLGLEPDDRPPGRRSSSEEKESMTPAQSRRKAQNRAAQRAFRERKERHVRDLEAKLNLLTTTTSSLQSDNEKLKMMLQRARTENQILKATASVSPTAANPPALVDDPGFLTSPCISRPTVQAKDIPQLNTINSTSHARRKSSGFGSFDSSSCENSPLAEPRLLSASATWDFLQAHPLYLMGAVDIGEVCERLKKFARCESMGPVFDEDDVRRVIEEVGRSGGDELI